MVFKGDFIFDFNLITALESAIGKIDIVEIFGGAAGVELITWFGLAYVPIVPSASWLDGDNMKALLGPFAGYGNHILAGVVTLLYYIIKNKKELFDNPILAALQKKICSAGAETPSSSKALVAMGKGTGFYTNKTACNLGGGGGEDELALGGDGEAATA